jgi:hypothetical protein
MVFFLMVMASSTTFVDQLTYQAQEIKSNSFEMIQQFSIYNKPRPPEDPPKFGLFK